MLQPGTVLQGRYVIDRVLGHGGMGAVYLASIQTLGGKKVAIKEIVLADPRLRQALLARLRREAQILAALRHPGLVAVTDFFQEQDSEYLVMDYLAGPTLEELQVAAGEKLDLPLVMTWADRILEILEYLHGNTPPVVVGDLKPDNIMLDADGQLRLIDFGLARIFDPQDASDTLLKGSGTPGFAPVEQYGGRTDPRSDIYSLGATLYVLLTGSLPASSVFIVTGEERLVSPRTLNTEIPPAVEGVLLRMLELRRENRYQTATEAREALAAALGKRDPAEALDPSSPAGEPASGMASEKAPRPAPAEAHPKPSGPARQARLMLEGEDLRSSRRENLAMGLAAVLVLLLLWPSWVWLSAAARHAQQTSVRTDAGKGQEVTSRDDHVPPLTSPVAVPAAAASPSPRTVPFPPVAAGGTPPAIRSRSQGIAASVPPQGTPAEPTPTHRIGAPPPRSTLRAIVPRATHRRTRPRLARVTWRSSAQAWPGPALRSRTTRPVAHRPISHPAGSLQSQAVIPRSPSTREYWEF